MATVTATPGDALSNAYVELAFADALFADTLRETDWDGHSDDDKARAIIQATRQLDRERLRGAPLDGTTPQALWFPRNGDANRRVGHETFTSDAGTAVSLDQVEIVDGSETVETTDEATEYTEGTDYDMDYDAGTIEVLAAGTMDDATGYYISYQYLGIPEDVEEGICEQAMWLLQQRSAPDILDHRALQQQGVSTISLDGVSVSYGGTASSGWGPRAWELVQRYVERTAPIVGRAG